MKIMKIRNAALVALTLTLTATASLPAWSAQPKAPGQTGNQARWSQKMRELYATLSELMTDVSSDQRFADPANQKRIERNAQKLAKLAHDLKGKEVAAPDRDPSVGILGEMFADETQRAYKSLKWGNKGYARELLRSSSSYCIACHTRTNTGPSFSELPMNPSARDLKASERGAFFAATRQYDRALAEFNAVLDARGGVNPLEWASSVRHALAIAVRVKRDPDLALGIVEKVIGAKTAPYYFRQDAIAWRESIRGWKSEPKREALGEEGLHAEAVRLLAKAREAQKYPADRGADVLYLRASAVVHDLLGQSASGKYSDEAYLMAGLCYDVLRPFQIGELHEVYYEGCIRKSPHSPLAETCYRRLEQSVYDGFTGSSGVHLPTDVQNRLKTLEALARVPDQNLSAQPK